MLIIVNKFSLWKTSITFSKIPGKECGVYEKEFTSRETF